MLYLYVFIPLFHYLYILLFPLFPLFPECRKALHCNGFQTFVWGTNSLKWGTKGTNPNPQVRHSLTRSGINSQFVPRFVEFVPRVRSPNPQQKSPGLLRGSESVVGEAQSLRLRQFDRSVYVFDQRVGLLEDVTLASMVFENDGLLHPPVKIGSISVNQTRPPMDEVIVRVYLQFGLSEKHALLLLTSGRSFVITPVIAIPRCRAQHPHHRGENHQKQTRNNPNSHDLALLNHFDQIMQCQTSEKSQDPEHVLLLRFLRQFRQ